MKNSRFNFKINRKILLPFNVTILILINVVFAFSTQLPSPKSFNTTKIIIAQNSQEKSKKNNLKIKQCEKKWTYRFGKYFCWSKLIVAFLWLIIIFSLGVLLLLLDILTWFSFHLLSDFISWSWPIFDKIFDFYAIICNCK